jgi:multidrug efflux pump subunit AcrA (membrane-fusion protein)
MVTNTIKEEKVVKVDLATEHENEAIYLVDDYHSRALEVEKHIEQKYPNCRLQTYRTRRKALGLEHLRMYTVCMPQFPSPHPDPGETDLRKIADKSFLATAPRETFDRYQALLERKSVSQQEFDEAQARYRAKSAEVERAKEMLMSVQAKKEQKRRFDAELSIRRECQGARLVMPFGSAARFCRQRQI